eukprot:g17091.t2
MFLAHPGRGSAVAQGFLQRNSSVEFDFRSFLAFLATADFVHALHGPPDEQLRILFATGEGRSGLWSEGLHLVHLERLQADLERLELRLCRELGYCRPLPPLLPANRGAKRRATARGTATGVLWRRALQVQQVRLLQRYQRDFELLGYSMDIGRLYEVASGGGAALRGARAVECARAMLAPTRGPALKHAAPNLRSTLASRPCRFPSGQRGAAGTYSAAASSAVVLGLISQRAAFRTPRAAFRASARALRKRGLTLLARGGEAEAIEAPTTFNSAVGGRLRVKQILEAADGGKSLIGQKVTVCGWLRTVRGQKSIVFLKVNDGSTVQDCQKGCAFNKQITMNDAVSLFLPEPTRAYFLTAPNTAPNTAHACGAFDWVPMALRHGVRSIHRLLPAASLSRPRLGHARCSLTYSAACSLPVQSEVPVARLRPVGCRWLSSLPTGVPGGTRVAHLSGGALLLTAAWWKARPSSCETAKTAGGYGLRADGPYGARTEEEAEVQQRTQVNSAQLPEISLEKFQILGAKMTTLVRISFHLS